MSNKAKNQTDHYPALIHFSDEYPGYSRRRHGRGFTIFDEQGNRITDKSLIDRIKNIAIPPVWKEVWICPDPRGHLQATGIDNKGRKQYLYHDSWNRFQQETKFDNLAAFGYALPGIRKRIQKDLDQPQWTRERVIALIIGILDETYIRIGNKEYLHMNQTHGLTTLRRRHLSVGSRGAVFKYKGKHKKEHIVRISNKRFVKLVKECSDLPGHEIFRYKNDNGSMTPVNSYDVNEYLKNITGDSFTSKNFRTWGATVSAIKRYPHAKKRVKENPRLNLRRAIVKEVAAILNNTIATCEKYYIHPGVLDALDSFHFSPHRYKISLTSNLLDFEEKVALAIIG